MCISILCHEWLINQLTGEVPKYLAIWESLQKKE